MRRTKEKQMSKQMKKSYSLPPVRAPEDTSRQDPMLHMLGTMAMGSTPYIEAQERQGQAQLAKSTTIPTRLNGCTEDQLRALGFELGPVPTTGDTLFRPALLPQGWKIVPTDHSMWSDLVDSRGFVRGSMFYKAAFYDRGAHLGLSVRLHIREDYEARKLDGTIAHDIYADLPGKDAKGEQNRKVLHRYEHPEKFPDHRVARGHEHPYFLAMDAARTAASAWLRENYPDCGKVMAYWDQEF